MLNSRVIDILKTFSTEELKRFGEFLNSPYHNKNKKAILHFEFLSKYHPAYDNKNLTKEKLFAGIFSNGAKDYNDASIRNLFSDLTVLAERYLSFVRFEKDRFDFNEKFLRELSERKLTGIFEKKIKSLEELTFNNEFDGEEYFYKKFVIEELKSSSRQFGDNLKLYKDNSGIRTSEYLSYFYLIKIFKLVNFFEFQKQYNVYNEKNFAVRLLEGFNLEKAIDDLEKQAPSMKDVKILKVYFKMYKSIINPHSDDFYFDFKDSLLENDSSFSLLERLGLYICLTNCCVKKIDSGKDGFSRECFDIYMLMFEKDLYSVYPGYFPMSAYSTVIHTGVASGEFIKVEEFIDSYSLKLNSEHANDAVNYSKALVCFHKKEFERSLEFISKTDTDFSQFKFLLKILSLKIYYETGDYESLYYASDSFQHFLNKNKLVDENYKSNFSNFIKMLDLIVRYRSLKEDKILFKIEEQLKNKSMAGKKWLKEKINEINS